MRRIWMGLLTLMAAFAGGSAAYVAHQVAQAPTVTTLKAAKVPQPSVLMSADGQVLGKVQEVRQEPVKLAQVSPHVIHALIATEDRRFESHHGIDWIRCVKAVFRTAVGRTEGGSTITQQLVRNIYPEEIGRSRNLSRKIKEMATAVRIERIYSKDQILEAYLNSVSFLYNAVGIEAAAQTYFGKSAKQLDPLESATLVGMLKGTHYYNPVLHPKRAKERRNLVLAQMVKSDKLTSAEFAQLREQPLGVTLTTPSERWNIAPHFAAYVRKWLDEWAQHQDYDLARDGLIVQTTLDSRLQGAATKAVERQTAALQQVADVEWSQASVPAPSRVVQTYDQSAKKGRAFEHFWRQHPEILTEALRHTPEYEKLVAQGKPDTLALAEVRGDNELVARVKAEKTRLQAGFVAIDPRTGAVKAWVGSRDYMEDQFDHVAQAERQPGSTFKPIVYAAAMEMGIPPSRTYLDQPVAVQLGNGRIWRPTDMSGNSGRPMTMWEGLVYSKNTITTQVMQDAGLPRIAELAHAMGIDSKLDSVPSMALGTSPVSLLEMATVYSTIANGGTRRTPYVVERITDQNGHVLAEFGIGPSEPALPVDVVNNLIDMMRGVVSQGTGGMMHTRFAPGVDIAGKTGTTQNNMDAWFIAMHPQLVAGSWVGFNDQRVTMRSSYWGQGGHSALLLVGDFMQNALQRKWVDASATFATPVRPPIVASIQWSSVGTDALQEGMEANDSAASNPITTDPAGTASQGDERDPASTASGDWSQQLVDPSRDRTVDRATDRATDPWGERGAIERSIERSVERPVERPHRKANSTSDNVRDSSINASNQDGFMQAIQPMRSDQLSGLAQ